jgi:malate dehydrogenase (oxaloacetate-decarboxylating)
VFRGALDAKAVTITDEMMVAASAELAKFAEEKGISENYIIPTMEEWEVYPRVAATVAQKAVEQGLARNKMSWQEFHERARQIIEESRLVLSTLVKNGLIQMPPKVEKII